MTIKGLPNDIESGIDDNVTQKTIEDYHVACKADASTTATQSIDAYGACSKAPQDKNSAPFTWEKFYHGYRSYKSRRSAFSAYAANAVLGVCACNAICAALSVNAMGSILSANSFASILSVNSLFSIASVNSMFAVGCAAESFKICLG